MEIYNKLLEKAKVAYSKCATGAEKRRLEYIFPELAESEDEKIKRCISDIVRKYGVEFTTGTITKEKMLAWLEKQGTLKKVSIWKHWKGGLIGNGDGKPIYLVKNGNRYSLDSYISCECDYVELSELNELMLEKQEEQKSCWSDEDENRFNNLIHLVENSNEGKATKNGFVTFINKLKSRMR